MPVFAADLLPDATGRNLGNPSQLWNANLQTLNVSGQVSLQPVAGQTITPGGVIYAATAPVTANANTIAAQNLCGCTIAANLLNASGKILRCTLAGTCTTQAGQTPGLRIFVSFAGVYLFAIGTGALPAATTNLSWRANFTVSVSTPGSAGQVESAGYLFHNTTVGNNAASPLVDINAAAIGPFDLTASQPLQTTCLFITNTSPANVCTQRQFIVEVMN